MSGRMSKSKGMRGEYAVRDLLQPIVDEMYAAASLPAPVLERNVEQVRHGGSDLVGLDWLAIEVKHQETKHIGAWWAQVKEASLPQHLRSCPFILAFQEGTPVNVTTSSRPAGCTCGAKSRTPILIYRSNREPWRVVMFGYLVAGPRRVKAPVDISVEAFLAWFRADILRELSGGKE